MEKHLILGFLGKNLKGHPRLSDDVIAQFIRGNVPLGYDTVLTGINGVFERNCAKVALAQRDAGLGVKLTIALTKQKFETYLRFARDGRPLNDELKIIPQADDLQIIGGDSSLSARICSITPCPPRKAISGAAIYRITLRRIIRSKTFATSRNAVRGHSSQKKPACAISGFTTWRSVRAK